MTKLEKEFIINLTDDELEQIRAGKDVSTKICKSIRVIVRRENNFVVKVENE